MEAVGQRVDHRHRRRRGQLRDPLVAEGAEHDRGDVAGQHPGGVRERLAPAEVGGLRVDDDRVAAELGDAGLERDAGCAGDGLSKSTATDCGPASGR